MKKSCFLSFVLLLIVSMTLSVQAITVDGILSPGEWDGYYIADPVDNGNPGTEFNGADSVEMLGWGVYFTSTDVYWFIEVDPDYPLGASMGSRYLGLWVDADNSDATYLVDIVRDDYGVEISRANMVDNMMTKGEAEYTEWKVNHRGIDYGVEAQIKDDDTLDHFDHMGLSGENTNVTGVADYNLEWSTTVVEGRISLVELATQIAATGTPLGDLIKVGAAIEGSHKTDGVYDIAWGYDVTAPITLDLSIGGLAGDANKDGKVDGSDVTILAGNWQKGVSDGQQATWAMGDFNGDFKVDGSDVTILAGNWQAGVTTAAASVPEPGTLILLACGLVSLLLWRKNR